MTESFSRRQRRTYSSEFKAACVAEAKLKQTSVAAIARRHEVNHNLIFKWWREADAAGAVTLLPVTVVAPTPSVPTPSSQTSLSLALADGSVLRIDSVSDALMLVLIDRLRSR